MDLHAIEAAGARDAIAQWTIAHLVVILQMAKEAPAVEVHAPGAVDCIATSESEFTRAGATSGSRNDSNEDRNAASSKIETMNFSSASCTRADERAR